MRVGVQDLALAYADLRLHFLRRFRQWWPLPSTAVAVALLYGIAAPRIGGSLTGARKSGAGPRGGITGERLKNAGNELEQSEQASDGGPSTGVLL